MLEKIRNHVDLISRMMLFMVVDIIAINVAFLLEVYIHFEGHVPSNILVEYSKLFIIITLIKVLVFNSFKLYSSLWQYASIEELIKVLGAVTSGNIIGIVYMEYMDFHMFAGSYLVILLLEIAFVGGSRFSYRFLRRIKQSGKRMRNKYNNNILIVGSGSTASMIATEIKNHPEHYGMVVGYIEDDEKKLGKSIGGIRVLGNRHEIYGICRKHKVSEIIIATPTASNEDKKEVINECRRTNIKVKIVPGILEIIDGHVSMNKIREVQIEDLLGRDPVDLNVKEIASYIEQKVVMITGGGGSIGSEICRQIARFNPKKLIILDIYENNAYDIQTELKRNYKNELDLDVIIASVRDQKNINRIFREHQPDVVFHAAAHKHVPLMERSPKEAIKNNVFGTLNLVKAADASGVERFVMISTDKAVNPTNVMGASKRMCEMVVQSMAKQSKTKFVAVRFGNVLGSNGSVIPLFKKQIKEGGPVTVTHKEIIRYFMTIPEASQLVIQAGAIANGGEIFVLDMGEPVKIYDLAEDLIKLSGFKPHEDIEIKVTGLRPGEKLYEELLMEEEGLENTKYSKIFVGQPGDIDFVMMEKSLVELKNIIEYGENEDLMDMIGHLIPTYQQYTVVNQRGGHGVESISKYRTVEG